MLSVLELKVFPVHATYSVGSLVNFVTWVFLVCACVFDQGSH